MASGGQKKIENDMREDTGKSPERRKRVREGREKERRKIDKGA